MIDCEHRQSQVGIDIECVGLESISLKHSTRAQLAECIKQPLRPKHPGIPRPSSVSDSTFCSVQTPVHIQNLVEFPR